MKRDIFVATAAVGLVAVALWIGPRIEISILPVLTAQRVDDISRLGDRLCWKWIQTKRRDLKPIRLDMELIVADIVVRAIPQRTDRTAVFELTHRPPGYSEATFCITPPAHLTSAKELRVEARMLYEPGHPYWTLRQRMPTVVWRAPPPPMPVP